MNPNKMRIGTFAVLFSLSLWASASAIPDDPVTAIEPGLEIDDRVGGGMGWMDSHTLLVTALASSKSQFWDRKVMRIDIRTGEAKELIYPGVLMCVNPVDKVAGVLLGDHEGVYAGKRGLPDPELKLHGWSSSGALTPKKASEGWNAFICKKTKPEDANEPSIGFWRKETRYLESKDGYLIFSPIQSSSEKNVVLVRNEKPVATPDVKPIEIAPVPQYLPFRDEYLLSSGRFVMNGTMQRPNEAGTTEYPVLTMTTSGKVKRDYFRPLFEDSGLKVAGETYPYAKGTMIFILTRPEDGGGIYLNQGESIRRIWCTNWGNTPDRKCNVMSFSISPDGCNFAFFAKGSDNLKLPHVYRPTLKILPLCK